jgi:hypothetical protein
MLPHKMHIYLIYFDPSPFLKIFIIPYPPPYIFGRANAECFLSGIQVTVASSGILDSKMFDFVPDNIAQINKLFN